MDERMIKKLEEMAETSPQIGMFLAGLKFEARERAKGSMPTKGFGDLPGSLSDLGEHWPTILSEPDEEYLKEDEKYFQAFLAEQKEKGDG